MKEIVQWVELMSFLVKKRTLDLVKRHSRMSVVILVCMPSLNRREFFKVRTLNSYALLLLLSSHLLLLLSHL